jgi:hypothetical protein
MYMTYVFNRVYDQLLFIFVTDVNTTSDEVAETILLFSSDHRKSAQVCSCTSLIAALHMSPAYVLGDQGFASWRIR